MSGWPPHTVSEPRTLARERSAPVDGAAFAQQIWHFQNRRTQLQYGTAMTERKITTDVLAGRDGGAQKPAVVTACEEPRRSVMN